MLSLSFGLIMFICIVPCMIITFIQIFPKNWQSRNLILGVKNREEYKTGEAKETVIREASRGSTEDLDRLLRDRVPIAFAE